ncbi:DUF6686 family protein [Dyadobacter subterraneus]|uniref:Uncharacterized protein n=1 Tax=Dyadobacter subterraneus TaxID=2773304 RepID=A0ABR9W7F3_9BACT|nr:DUF6686 family protein [Dyadobacter subterraneus]MBE9461400.1 hypothetical protein [Dyadobacter subterraneus]
MDRQTIYVTPKMSHHTKTLSERPNGYVGYCDCCARYNVSFNNSLFIFSNIEFAGFKKLLTERIGLNPFFTTHGKEVIAQTPMKNYYLVFSEAEIQQLLDMMIEASLIVETNQILMQTDCRSEDDN